MENDKRQPFKKYKELRVYFGVTQYAVIQYDCEGMEFAKSFDWFKFSSRGATFKDTNSGMTIHFKYSSVDCVNDNDSRALILEDVELYTPFIKTEDGVIKFITWEEWNEKYNTEEICKRITSVTDEHLKEHNTELMYILDKLCSCAAHPNFDHPHRFIKVEPRYQDSEYSLHRVVADFKSHYGTKMYDYIRYLFEYTPKNRTIHIDISKHETWVSSPIFSTGLLLNTLQDDFKADTYSIDVEFNKDYSISKVTVKNKNKENLLKFMEMGNPVINDTIRQIRDYINAKLTEKQLTSRINVTSEENMYTQTWNFSPRVDVRPNTESYDTEKEFTLNKYGVIYAQIKNECEWIYKHPNTATHTDELNRTTIWGGSVLSLSSGTFEEATREKIHFHFDTFGTFRRITIEILDPNREKLKVTLGIEGSQLVSIALKPGFDNFEKVIDRIYNPRVKRLVSEIFNKLYKGEE